MGVELNRFSKDVNDERILTSITVLLWLKDAMTLVLVFLVLLSFAARGTQAAGESILQI